MNEILAALNVLLPVAYTASWCAYLCLFVKNTDECRDWSRRGLDAVRSVACCPAGQTDVSHAAEPTPPRMCRESLAL